MAAINEEKEVSRSSISISAIHKGTCLYWDRAHCYPVTIVSFDPMGFLSANYALMYVHTHTPSVLTYMVLAWLFRTSYPLPQISNHSSNFLLERAQRKKCLFLEREKAPKVTTKDGLVKKQQKSSTDLEKEAQLWKRLGSRFYLRKRTDIASINSWQKSYIWNNDLFLLGRKRKSAAWCYHRCYILSLMQHSIFFSDYLYTNKCSSFYRLFINHGHVQENMRSYYSNIASFLANTL